MPQNIPSITYVPHPIYHPSPHYRPHTGTYSSLTPPPQPPDDVIIHEAIGPPNNTPAQPPSKTTGSESITAALPGVNTGLPTEKELTADDVVAVLEAALRQAANQSSSGSEVDCNGNDNENQFSPVDSIGAGLDHQMEEELMELCVLTDYGSESALTEDGDSMLNSGKLHP